MSPAPRWIAVSAASALGLGIIATGAVGVANAIPLVDSTTAASVPPISTVPVELQGDVKSWSGTGDVTFSVPSSTPDVSSTVAPTAEPTTPVQQAPAPAPRPVAPDSVSPASPASVDSAD
jgi:hypothetical protein